MSGLDVNLAHCYAEITQHTENPRKHTKETSMAVSMIASYADSSGGGSSRLLDFSAPSSGDSGAAAAPPMDASASAMAPMDTSALQAPMPMDNSAMPGPTDSFQSSGPIAYTPPPEAMPSPSGSFDFVA